MADPGFFRGGYASSQKSYYFSFFAENCMKMKEFWPPGRRPWRPPLDPPMVMDYFFLQVHTHVIKTYLSAWGATKLVGFAFGLLVICGAKIGSNIWLSIWSEDSTLPHPEDKATLRVSVYGGLGSGLSQCFSSFFFQFQWMNLDGLLLVSGVSLFIH